MNEYLLTKMCFGSKNVSLTVVVLSLVFGKVPNVSAVTLDSVDCGIDNSPDVLVGNVPVKEYPWLGILYYSSHDMTGESRAVTTVALIQKEFVIAPASDIGPMPKGDFRMNTKVLLGEEWNGEGHRVRNYIIHPEYGETLNTVALVQLKDIVRDLKIKPVCPPPALLRDPEFYVMKFHENYNDLQKQVVPVTHVPGTMCKDFYLSANLYAKKLRPPHVACAVQLDSEQVCVWEPGAMLVVRDVWGRWQLVGMGVRGPGCGAPSRYLDMMSYYPWIEASLNKFKRLTISKMSNTKFVLRSGSEEKTYMRYGACDPEEKINLIYREVINLRTDNSQFQFFDYNMSVYETVEYSCLTLELVKASAVSQMSVRHYCPRQSHGPVCYGYKGSVFEIAVHVVYSDTCMFEMNAWGWHKNLTLLDVQEWKWEEGTYYEDFSMTRVEYRGPRDQTTFGFEPLDEKLWVPDYDMWTTTEFDNSSWSSTTPRANKGDGTEGAEVADTKGGALTRAPLPPGGTTDPESEFMIGIQW